MAARSSRDAIEIVGEAGPGDAGLGLPRPRPVRHPLHRRLAHLQDRFRRQSPVPADPPPAPEGRRRPHPRHLPALRVPEAWSEDVLCYWNEQYVLAALLANSAKYEILVGEYFLQRDGIRGAAAVRALRRSPASFREAGASGCGREAELDLARSRRATRRPAGAAAGRAELAKDAVSPFLGLGCRRPRPAAARGRRRGREQAAPRGSGSWQRRATRRTGAPRTGCTPGWTRPSRMCSRTDWSCGPFQAAPTLALAGELSQVFVDRHVTAHPRRSRCRKVERRPRVVAVHGWQAPASGIRGTAGAGDGNRRRHGFTAGRRLGRRRLRQGARGARRRLGALGVARATRSPG